MKLNQRQIDIFNAIMTNKSMTAAAGAVGTSQPTISREIRELERRIGFELFLRFGKRLTPTDQAVLLHEVVRRSFVGLDEISRAASAIWLMRVKDRAANPWPYTEGWVRTSACIQAELPSVTAF